METIAAERVTRLAANLVYGEIVRCWRDPTRQARVRRTLVFRWFEPSLPANIKTKAIQMDGLCFYGAGDEARTRYLHLGKVALYRMSYTRNGHDAL